MEGQFILGVLTPGILELGVIGQSGFQFEGDGVADVVVRRRAPLFRIIFLDLLARGGNTLLWGNSEKNA